MDISFESNIREWTRYVGTSLKRQVPFATAKALTETARGDVKPAIERRMHVAFENPTPFTLRGVAYRSGNKRNLIATVFIKDVQAGYLQLEEIVGTRRPKAKAIVIAVGQRVNKYGNMPRGAVQKLLAKQDVFSGRIGNVAGIWKRTKRGPKLMARYVERAQYRPRFQFNRTAQAIAMRRFPNNFVRAFDQAIRTAR